MSAYMMTNDDLVAIALCATHIGFGVDCDAVTAAYATLYAGNVASLQARYPNDWESMISPPLARIRPADVKRSEARKICPLRLIRIARAYNYQACEVSTEENPYEATEAFAIAYRAILNAIDSLPGYAEM